MAGNTALPRLVATAMAALVGALNQIIDRIERALNVLEAHPLAGMAIVTQTIGAAADTRVYHGLGRAALGYFIVRCSADVRVCDGLVSEAIDPANYVSLRASSAQTVTLAVF